MKTKQLSQENTARSLELTQLKIEQLNKQPILETSIQISEDGKWIMHKTIITDIKPISYFEKVLSNSTK